MTDNNEIIMWLYLFNNEITDETEIIELFKIINNNKPINEDELPTKRKIELLNINIEKI